MPVQTQRGGRGVGPKSSQTRCYKETRGQHHAPDTVLSGDSWSAPRSGHCTVRRLEVSTTLRTLYCQETRGQHHAPDTVLSGKTKRRLYRRPGGPWDRCEWAGRYSSKTGIRSPIPPARIESLFWQLQIFYFCENHKYNRNNSIFFKYSWIHAS